MDNALQVLTFTLRLDITIAVQLTHPHHNRTIWYRFIHGIISTSYGYSHISQQHGWQQERIFRESNLHWTARNPISTLSIYNVYICHRTCDLSWVNRKYHCVLHVWENGAPKRNNFLAPFVGCYRYMRATAHDYLYVCKKDRFVWG